MKIRALGVESDGTRNFEIRNAEIANHALVRAVRGIPEILVIQARWSMFTGEVYIKANYKGEDIIIETAFSDYTF